MPALRRAQVRFCEVVAIEDEGEVGVRLGFKPERSRLGVDFVEDYATLGPEYCIPAVEGMGKVLRLLRAARVAVPDDPEDALIGDTKLACELLERALGTLLRVELKPRSRLRFTAWTEEGEETIEAVAHVHETDEGYLVVRRHGPPVHFSKESVVRQTTDCEKWFEVVSIERA